MLWMFEVHNSGKASDAARRGALRDTHTKADIDIYEDI